MDDAFCHVGLVMIRRAEIGNIYTHSLDTSLSVIPKNHVKISEKRIITFILFIIQVMN